MSTSYAVIGTGALGGYYGARLQHAGLDVHFLLHSDYDHVREHGLHVESTDGDFSIGRPQVYASAADLPECDVVMVCLKTTQNHLLADLLPAAVTPASTVLMMQNGLGPEEAAAAAVPDNTIVGGLAFLCSNKVGPGHICHLDYGQVIFGQYRADGQPAGITDIMRTIGSDFEAAGISVDLEENLALARWKKLVWNIPFNGLTVVHGCATDILMADPETRALSEGLMNEVVAAAEGCGHIIDPSFVNVMLEATKLMAAYKPSMKLDHERGQPLEIEAIYGNPLRAAREAGVDCPLIMKLYEQLQERDPARAA